LFTEYFSLQPQLSPWAPNHPGSIFEQGWPIFLLLDIILQPEPAEKILKENTTAQLGQKKNTRPQRFNPPISIPFEGVNHGHDKTG
jgi:hypothetical protein